MSVDPAAGPLGSTITVSGAGFQSGDVVKLNVGTTIIALTTMSMTSDTIVATLPTSGVTVPASATVDVTRNGSPSATAPFQLTSGHIYYIAADGNDSASGSISAPWKSIDVTAGKMKPGDLAYVRVGTYAAYVSVSASGAAGAPITFMAYPGESALLNATLTMTGSYLTFDHLHVHNTAGTDSGIGIDVQQAAHNVVISNCEVYGSTGQGIIVSGTSNQFLRNSIHDNGTHSNLDHGIYVQSNNNTFRYNHIYNNWDYGIQLYNGVAGLVGGGNVVEYNFIYHNGYGAQSAGNNYSAGIILADGHPNETVRYNIICDNAAYGIYAVVESGQTITGNVSCSNHAGGFYIDPSAKVTMSGNISYDDANWALQLSPGSTSDYGTYWNGGNAPTLQWSGTGYSLSGFQSASGQDAHSTVTDPKFSSAPSTGFVAASATSYNFCTSVNPALCVHY